MPAPATLRSHPPIIPPLSEFILFPNLPSELRLQIWHHSPQPRIISIKQDITFEIHNRGTIPHRCMTVAARLPAIFSTCCESRVAAFELYQLHFHHQLAHPIYFNPQIDGLYMTTLGTPYSFFRATKLGHRAAAANPESPDFLLEAEEAAYVAFKFDRFRKPDNYNDMNIMVNIKYINTLFPDLQKIGVAGYDEQLWEKEEVAERISKNYMNEMYRGKRRIGLSKMGGGKFVERVPRGEIPEIEF